MGWDAAFWKHRPGAVRRDPLKIYGQLHDGVDLSDELDVLPGEAFVARLRERLPAGTWEDTGPGATGWLGAGGKGAVDVRFTPCAAVASCYGLNQAQKNLVIEAGIDIGASLYDPQTGERFDDRGRRP